MTVSPVFPRFQLQLLTCSVSPLGSTLIPALDVHFDETNPTASCKRGDVIELQGPATSGKTHLLYYLLINCLLPSDKLNGWGKAAVFFDTYSKFDVQRFSRLLSSRAKRLLPDNPSAVEAITTKSLGLLHIFRPTNSQQFAATMRNLPVYLATNLPDADLGILAIDSMTSFYWPDRYLLEQTRLGNSSHILARSPNPLNYAFASIRSFAQSYGPLVVLSSWDLNPSVTPQNGQYVDTSTPAVQSDSTRSRQQILPISQYITLRKTDTYLGDEECTESKSAGSKFTTATTSLSGTVRTPGNSRSAQFILHITEDDILVP